MNYSATVRYGHARAKIHRKPGCSRFPRHEQRITGLIYANYKIE